jgi:dCTP diphosphatase
MSSTPSFDQVDSRIREFSHLRNWDRFHQPKNLILAAMGELGELAEILQWKTDAEVVEYLSTIEGKGRMSEEIADVVIYLMRLCQTQNIDLFDAILEKMDLNEINYPVEKSKDNSAKYSELKQL